MSSQTEVPRSFKHGFILSEQELRRVVSASREQLRKVGSESSGRFTANLRDHSVIESDDIEEIIALENGGPKEIRNLELKFESGDNCEHAIEIRFVDAHRNPKTWESIGLKISSSDRDWAFLTASNLEDRIAKLKLFSLPHWWSTSVFGSLLYGLIVVLLIFGFNEWVEPHFIKEVDKPSELRDAYESGKFKDTIEALIFIEEQKAKSKSGGWYLAYFAAIFILPLTLSWALKKIATRVYSAYVFNWGDQIALHQKAMGRIKILFVAVGLGLVVSVLGSVIMKFVWP